MTHFLFGILGSVTGALGAFALAWWVSIVTRPSTSDERVGAAFLMFLAPMAGVVFGFMGGIAYSKMAQAGHGLQFLQVLGRAAAGIVLFCAVIGAWTWWSQQDWEPRVDGKLIEMEFELRMPVGYVPPAAVPSAQEERGDQQPHIQISGKGKWREYRLRNQDAKLVDGRLVLRGIIPLQTDPANKDIQFFLGSEATSPGRIQGSRYQGSFGFPAFRPGKEDFEWTAWLRASWEVEKPKPTMEECFNLRYRYKFREPGRESQEVYSIP